MFVHVASALDVFRATDEVDDLSLAEVRSLATGLECKDPSLAVQSSRDEADINVIVGRFLQTGVLPQGAAVPSFAEFEDVFDFQSAQNALVAADRAFMAIPAAIRARFENDPQKFISFCEDSGNLPELRKLGFAIPAVEPAPAPAVVPVVPPA